MSLLHPMKGFKPPIVKNSAKICPFVRMKDIGLKVILIHSAVFICWYINIQSNNYIIYRFGFQGLKRQKIKPLHVLLPFSRQALAFPV